MAGTAKANTHTPGPWLAEDADDFGDHNIVPLDQSESCLAIAAVVENCRASDEVAANARLIAAAPDFLLAAQLLMLAAEEGDADKAMDAHDQLRAAIAKATGSA
jgi:hypothetical protein